MIEIVNSGNWGDALIHAGQAEFLKDFGLQIHKIPISKLKKIRYLESLWRKVFKRGRAIVTGHGAYYSYYARADEITNAARQFSAVLVMPSSLPRKLNFDPNRTILWRRDDLESAAAMPEARFCHDMAFYLQPHARTATQEVGYLFRTDIEKADFALPKGNIDISNEGTHRDDADIFLDKVGTYKVIHTNRLHVGIAGALLGREVHLYSNSTKKIRSVFESSLRPFYQNVHFHENSEHLVALSR